MTSTGYNGSGQTVALWEFDGFQQSNITKYDSNYATGSPTPKVQKVSGGSDDNGDGSTSVDFPASDPYVTGVGVITRCCEHLARA